jgi:hypothetical protein
MSTSMTNKRILQRISPTRIDRLSGEYDGHSRVLEHELLLNDVIARICVGSTTAPCISHMSFAGTGNEAVIDDNHEPSTCFRFT